MATSKAKTDTKTNEKTDRVWLITGCSTGFGRQLAQAALARGLRVVVTARNAAQVQDLAVRDRSLVLPLDVTKPDQVESVVKRAEATFGRVDVLVNNAGIGYFAAVEESEEAEVRKMFEINFFGLARMIHAVLPGMRERRAGMIINMSSVGGLTSFPSLGYYNASKFAVEGLSEALAKEVAPLGIKVMLVEPSGFRTDWAGRSAQNGRVEIADYATSTRPTQNEMRSASGRQAGDPARAAEAILSTAEMDSPPLHLLLGKDSVRFTREKLDDLRRDIDRWEATSQAADFPVAS
ncbi:MAG: SDR family NAD(P)-dependent oxidoreductase [Labilithrix sp.]|nr:SDR family NAD(P)-dependent oxidoreductase [Labilithrix sp.]